MKAIETRYKGYRFRSRLEARWAVFFDALNVPWEYEKEGFNLGAAGWYLPDFWLPGWNAWVEIKPGTPSAQERLKARALADEHRPVVMLIGSPGDELPLLFAHSSSNSGGGIFESDSGGLGIGSDHYKSARLIYRKGALNLWVDTSDSLFDCDWNPLRFTLESETVEYASSFSLVATTRALQPAYDAARAARFEHGEQPR